MKKSRLYLLGLKIFFMAFLLVSCSDNNDVITHRVETAEKVSVDRFSNSAGHLMVRDASNGLPEANAAINFDQGPFITKGLGPDGKVVEYYNFDVQSVSPAPIYVLFNEGSPTPVINQHNIIDVIPGDIGYNDFWRVVKVTVPSNYKANQVASYDEIVDAGYNTETTNTIVNCPVVPDGSTATKRIGGEYAGLSTGWYREKIVTYFTFGEKALMAINNQVPTSPIYVCFNINAGDVGGGPESGFKVEPGTTQTHNVVATIPSSALYSPLWLVSAYDNNNFDTVINLSTAVAGPITNLGATVNCPIVTIQ